MIKQCLKGKSVACSRSKDIKERLIWEAIGKVSLIVQKISRVNVKPSLFSSLQNTNSGPATAPTSRSATVRFIMRYVLRLRRWRILAKAAIVMPLIIDMTRNSVMKTGDQTGVISWNGIQRSFWNGVLVFICVLLKSMRITIIIISSFEGSNMTFWLWIWQEIRWQRLENLLPSFLETVFNVFLQWRSWIYSIDIPAKAIKKKKWYYENMLQYV